MDELNRIVFSANSLDTISILYDAAPDLFHDYLNDDGIINRLRDKYGVKEIVGSFLELIDFYDLTYGTRHCYDDNSIFSCTVAAAKHHDFELVYKTITTYNPNLEFREEVLSAWAISGDVASFNITRELLQVGGISDIEALCNAVESGNEPIITYYKDILSNEVFDAGVLGGNLQSGDPNRVTEVLRTYKITEDGYPFVWERIGMGGNVNVVKEAGKHIPFYLEPLMRGAARRSQEQLLIHFPRDQLLIGEVAAKYGYLDIVLRQLRILERTEKKSTEDSLNYDRYIVDMATTAIQFDQINVVKLIFPIYDSNITELLRFSLCAAPHTFSFLLSKGPTQTVLNDVLIDAVDCGSLRSVQRLVEAGANNIPIAHQRASIYPMIRDYLARYLPKPQPTPIRKTYDLADRFRKWFS